MRPSGAQTIDHGTSRFLTTVSTRKLTRSFAVAWPCSFVVPAVVSTSPAPRPGGGCPHASTNKVTKQNIANKILFIMFVRRPASGFGYPFPFTLFPVILFPFRFSPFTLFPFPFFLPFSVGCIRAAVLSHHPARPAQHATDHESKACRH